MCCIHFISVSECMLVDVGQIFLPKSYLPSENLSCYCGMLYKQTGREGSCSAVAPLKAFRVHIYSQHYAHEQAYVDVDAMQSATGCCVASVCVCIFSIIHLT